jgi:mRNA interferase MazF
MPDQGDIVLIPIPFSDLTSTKKRPAIVVSNNAYHVRYADLIVVAMTSNPQSDPFAFAIDNADLIKGHLKYPSKVRSDKIYSLSRRMVIKVLGSVKESVLEQIRQHWTILIAKI